MMFNIFPLAAVAWENYVFFAGNSGDVLSKIDVAQDPPVEVRTTYLSRSNSQATLLNSQHAFYG